MLDSIESTRKRADVEAITRCVEEVKQELAQIKTEVRAKPPPEPTKAHIPAWVKPQNQSKRKKNNGVKENYDGILFSGIPESMAGTVRELYDEDVEQVKQIFICLAVKNCPIDDVKRIGTYDQNNPSECQQRTPKTENSSVCTQNGNLRKRSLYPREPQRETE